MMCRGVTSKSCVRVFVITIACLLPSATALAAKFIKVTIEKDGKVIHESSYTGDDYDTRAEAWRYLSHAPIFDDQKTAIVPDKSDPLKATVTGNLVIKVKHVDSILAEVKASELRLIRSSEKSNGWYLPADEVERLAVANDIPEPHKPSPVRWGLGILAIPVLLLLAWSWMRQKGPEANADSTQRP